MISPSGGRVRVREVHVQDTDRLLTYREVLRATGFRSRTTIWNHVRDHSFPPPLRIGPNVVRWRASDISAWMGALPRQRYRELG